MSQRTEKKNVLSAGVKTPVGRTSRTCIGAIPVRPRTGIDSWFPEEVVWMRAEVKRLRAASSLPAGKALVDVSLLGRCEKMASELHKLRRCGMSECLLADLRAVIDQPATPEKSKGGDV